ncbi:MAG: hypothetical protein LBT19_02550 [Candidatus Nomurabacteria bacterium]|nr:hypothetical protein [Candidatus Nomurabacteria bacterium]
MADWLKIAIKTGLIIVIMVALWLCFTQIQLPPADFSILSSTGTILAVINFYCPVFLVVLAMAFGLFGIELALLSFRLVMMAVRWLMKVNE